MTKRIYVYVSCLALLAAIATWVVAGGLGQDRVYVYKPNEYEGKLIAQIKAIKVAPEDSLDFVERIVLAMQNDLSRLHDTATAAFDSILSHAGGFHKVICRPTIEALTADSGVFSELRGFLPRSGFYALKEITVNGCGCMVAYASDMKDRTESGACIIVGPGDSLYPIERHGLRYSAATDADSIKYILYHGDCALVAPPESVITSGTQPVIDGRYKFDTKFDKKFKEVVTMNIYGFSANRRAYDLFRIFIPSKILYDVKAPRHGGRS